MIISRFFKMRLRVCPEVLMFAQIYFFCTNKKQIPASRRPFGWG